MPLPNIHLNNGKYPQSGNFNMLVPYHAALAKFMQTSPNNPCSMVWAPTAIPMAMPLICR